MISYSTHFAARLAGRSPPILACAILACFAFACAALAAAPKAAPKPDLLVGKWAGTWSSTSNNMDGSLRCKVTRNDDGKYTAVFDATFARIFTFKSTVTLTAEADGDKCRFKGEKDLGLLAGGVYTYEGHTDGKEFYSTYNSSFDKGTFQMKRVDEKK